MKESTKEVYLGGSTHRGKPTLELNNEVRPGSPRTQAGGWRERMVCWGGGLGLQLAQRGKNRVRAGRSNWKGCKRSSCGCCDILFLNLSAGHFAKIHLTVH